MILQLGLRAADSHHEDLFDCWTGAKVLVNNNQSGH